MWSNMKSWGCLPCFATHQCIWNNDASQIMYLKALFNPPCSCLGCKEEFLFSRMTLYLPYQPWEKQPSCLPYKHICMNSAQNSFPFPASSSIQIGSEKFQQTGINIVIIVCNSVGGKKKIESLKGLGRGHTFKLHLLKS